MRIQPNRSKAAALSEVIAVLAVSQVVSWLWGAVPWSAPWAAWQRQHLHWNYFSHIVMIVLALGAVGIARRDRRAYGLSLAGWRRDLRWGLVFAVVLMGTLVVTAHLRGGLVAPPHPLSTLVFQIVFVGVGEELLFRGYVQSRLNEVFEKNLRVRGFVFGRGLLLASLLFGLAHLLNPFNPFGGRVGLDWMAGAMTVVYGFLFGLMREKTGSILMPAIVHASMVAFHLFPAAGPGFAVAWLINGILLFRVFGPSANGRTE